MKTSVLPTRWRTDNNSISTQFGLKFMLIVVCSIFYTSSFAQQKAVNQQEMQQKLTEVNEKIEEIDQTIAIINARIAGVPTENLDPSIQVRLNDLQILKDQYTREKTSIEAAMNSSHNSIEPNQGNETLRSTFLSLPNQSQDRRLAYSEPKTVNKNI